MWLGSLPAAYKDLMKLLPAKCFHGYYDAVYSRILQIPRDTAEEMTNLLFRSVLNLAKLYFHDQNSISLLITNWYWTHYMNMMGIKYLFFFLKKK
jgi:hypothetical protein